MPFGTATVLGSHSCVALSPVTAAWEDPGPVRRRVYCFGLGYASTSAIRDTERRELSNDVWYIIWGQIRP